MYIVRSFLIRSSFFLIFFCNAINGMRSKLPRYVIETDLKPAIFGSYSYDAVKGKFIVKEANISTTEINLTDIIFNNSTSSNNNDENYRKHVSIPVTTTTKSFNWWAETRELLKNTTLFKNKFNSNKTVANVAQDKLQPL